MNALGRAGHGVQELWGAKSIDDVWSHCLMAPAGLLGHRSLTRDICEPHTSSSSLGTTLTTGPTLTGNSDPADHRVCESRSDLHSSGDDHIASYTTTLINVTAPRCIQSQHHDAHMDDVVNLLLEITAFFRCCSECSPGPSRQRHIHVSQERRMCRYTKSPTCCFMILIVCEANHGHYVFREFSVCI